MKVFKFGGASIKNAACIRNVVEIIRNHADTPTLVVVSALGKTTNHLEELATALWPFVRQSRFRTAATLMPF